jgi:transposase-like protein
MARGSKTVTQLAGELGVSPSMLHRWRDRFEAELDDGVPQKSQGERESSYAADCATSRPRTRC